MTPISNEEEMNALNEQFYQENKARLLFDVLADWRATHLRMLEAVQVLSDEDLNDPHKFAWNGGNALWQNVAGNTYVLMLFLPLFWACQLLFLRRSHLSIEAQALCPLPP